MTSFMTNIMPLFFFWEKVLGVHTVRRAYLLKSLSRVPIVLIVWFFALAIPFFGPINSMMGAYFVSFTVYIIPNAAFIYVFSTKKAQQVRGGNLHFTRMVEKMSSHLLMQP